MKFSSIKKADDGFFFSSRRRHTRYWRDWSSDMCSSDLVPEGVEAVTLLDRHPVRLTHQVSATEAHDHCEQRRARKVEVGEQDVDSPPLVAGIDEQPRLALPLTGRRPGLQGPGDGSPRGHDPLGEIGRAHV